MEDDEMITPIEARAMSLVFLATGFLACLGWVAFTACRVAAAPAPFLRQPAAWKPSGSYVATVGGMKMRASFYAGDNGRGGYVTLSAIGDGRETWRVAGWRGWWSMAPDGSARVDLEDGEGYWHRFDVYRWNGCESVRSNLVSSTGGEKCPFPAVMEREAE